MGIKNIKYNDGIRKRYVIEIYKNVNNCIKNKAMLSFKYEYLNFWVNFTQITIIVLSGILTLMDSIKSYYNIDSNIYEIVGIFLTFLIGLIMAVYRFFKMDDRKENICNLLSNYTFIINKFKKLINTMDNFVITDSNIEDWQNIVSLYQTETLDNFVSIQETFDSIFSYKDKIFYKDKFKKLFLQQEMIDNEIETIHFFKKNNTRKKYINNDDSGCFSCCKKRKTIVDYDSFIEDNEPEYINMCNDGNKKRKKNRNQDLYYNTFDKDELNGNENENGDENVDENGDDNGDENGNENRNENGNENRNENGDENGNENRNENGNENVDENGNENVDENGVENGTRNEQTSMIINKKGGIDSIV